MYMEFSITTYNFFGVARVSGSGHSTPTFDSIVNGPTRSIKSDSSCDFVRRRPTIPVLLTAILYPSSMKSSFDRGETNIQSVVITKLYDNFS